MKRIVVCVLLGCVGAEFAAAEQMVAREQCTPLYTVQKKGCVAEHVLRCETPDGVVHRNEYVEDGALMGVNFSDADYEFLEEWSADGTTFLLEIVQNHDPFSLSELRDTGVDAFDQTAIVDMQIVAPREAHIVGGSMLTGNTLEIGDTAVDEISVEASLDLTSMQFWLQGTSYIDQATGTMFDGAYTFTIDGFSEDLPGEPVKILRGGDRGFMMNITLFGCGEQG